MFSCRPLFSIIIYMNHQWYRPTIWKTILLQYILKSSSSMYERSASQFFRSTTEIRSWPEDSDESRFVMTFLAVLGVTKILCSSRLVLKVKTGQEIPASSRLEFLEQFLSKNFLYQKQKIIPLGHWIEEV